MSGSLKKTENLYVSITGAPKDEEAVKSLVGEFAKRPPEHLLAKMKPVHIDPSATFENPMGMKTKEKKRLKSDRPLNSQERRQLKVYDIPREAHRYDLFVPLHNLWEGYMKDLYAQGTDPQSFARKMLKADFHGAIFTVTKSISPVHVGTTGIVVQETMNLFKIITKNNRLRQIPKAGTIFTMKIEACTSVFTLFGSQLQFRAAERAVRKFKAKATIDL